MQVYEWIWLQDATVRGPDMFDMNSVFIHPVECAGGFLEAPDPQGQENV